MRADTTGQRQRPGFTLVELLIVIAIIGIILAAILVAASDGVRRAEERATQGLITKLDAAVNDRIDALFNTQAPINQTHRYLAAVNYASGTSTYAPIPGSIEARAQVIAQNDFIRAEFPDVFYRNSQTTDGAKYAGNYPLNFAGIAYPVDNPSKDESDFMLPLGICATGILSSTTAVPGFSPAAGQSTGIFGASYSAAGGLLKNLGYQPKGYDGVDNGGNGYVDEVGESGLSASDIEAKLSKHTHKTARSETLYAVLVEGLGPLGSVFRREDFTGKEVQDTDGDGLPEFVDAWGEPLQFYRWPIYFGAVSGTSDSQAQSYLPYASAAVPRQQDPYDPNQQLTAPGWWYQPANMKLSTVTGISADFTPSDTSTSTTMSQGAMAFCTYFRSLIDPASSTTTGALWDRSGGSYRRAYFSKPLILSAGPDKEPGVGQFNKNYAALVDNPSGVSSVTTFPDSSLGKILAQSSYLIQIENQAGQTDPYPTVRTGSFHEKTSTTAVTSYLQNIAGTDDITNHNISAPGTGVR